MNNLKITDVRFHKGDSAFLIDDGKTAVLYDTGFAFTGYGVAENIKRVLGDRALDYIFLTHSHYDHALGSVYIKKIYPEAIIVSSEYAKNIFQKPSAKKVMRELDSKFAAKCGVNSYEDLIDSLDADITVSDNDIITAGDMKFKVISLPGHTRCSIGFYLESEKLLLNSETLGVYIGGDKVFPSYLIGYNITLESIDKAAALDIEKILLPHFGVIEGEETKKYITNAKLHAVETAKVIIDILQKNGSHQDCKDYIKSKYYKGEVKNIYPKDAMELNTSIMVKLIENEFIKKTI